jgi:hypothetical protein
MTSYPKDWNLKICSREGLKSPCIEGETKVWHVTERQRVSEKINSDFGKERVSVLRHYDSLILKLILRPD